MNGQKRKQEGFIIVLLAAGLLVMMCAFAGLAIDVSRAYVVQSELQNAGDAVSLAGASGMYPSAAYITPDWNKARATATSFLGATKADGQALTDVTVEYGWWNNANDNWEVGSPVAAGLTPTVLLQGYCSTSRTPCTSDAACTPNTEFCYLQDVPAVRTTVAKSAGLNGGPVQTYFAKMVGWNSFDSSVKATAIADTPAAMPPGTLYPFAVTQRLKDDFLTGTAPPGDITFTTNYGTTGAPPGQWTGLTLNNPHGGANTLAGYIRYLIDPSDNQATASPAVKVAGYSGAFGGGFNDRIHIEAGAVNSMIIATQQLISAGKGRVYMPVVNNDIGSHINSSMIVRGFVSVELTSASVPGTITGRLVMPSRLVR